MRKISAFYAPLPSLKEVRNSLCNEFTPLLHFSISDKSFLLFGSLLKVGTKYSSEGCGCSLPFEELKTKRLFRTHIVIQIMSICTYLRVQQQSTQKSLRLSCPTDAAHIQNSHFVTNSHLSVFWDMLSCCEVLLHGHFRPTSIPICRSRCPNGLTSMVNPFGYRSWHTSWLTIWNRELKSVNCWKTVFDKNRNQISTFRSRQERKLEIDKNGNQISTFRSRQERKLEIDKNGN